MTVGRLGLNHPALATAGGSALWTIINSIYQTIGDAVAGRYFSASAVTTSSTVTFTHNFGAPFSEYRYALYAATTGVITSRITSNWTVVANATNPTTAVDVTNVSGTTSDIIMILVHDGGTTNYSFLPFVQISTPSTPAAGTTLLYPKSDGNFYSLNSNGIEQVIGSGAGGGSKNYLSASASTATGWTGYGNVTISTDTTASDLPRGVTTKTGVKFQPSGATSGTFTSTGSGQTLTSTSAHGMLTGYVVSFSTSGTFPGPLTAATGYYVNVLTSTTFQVATTMANLLLGSYVTLTSAGSGTQSFTFGGGYARFGVDAADYTVVQQVAFAQNILSGVTGDWEIDFYSNTAAGGAGTYTRLTLSSDLSGSTILPNGILTFSAPTFSAPNATAPYVEVRLNKILPNTHALVLSDIIVGPGLIVQSGTVGSVVKFTPTFTNLTVTNNASSYCQVGQYARVQIDVTAASTATGQVLFNVGSLFSGATVDDTVWGARQSPGAGEYAGATNNYTIAATYSGPGSGTLAFRLDTVAANLDATHPTTEGGVVSGARLTITMDIPIAQWSGNASSYYGNNSPEYAFNTSTSTTANDTNSFGYGPGGALIGNITATIARYVRFPTPFQTGDQPVVQISADGNKWVDVTGATADPATGVTVSSYFTQNGINYGIGQPSFINSTDVQVSFGTTALANSTYGAAGQAWSAGAGAYFWRVKKIKAGIAVGFGQVVPGIAAGLVPATGLPGQTNGLAVPPSTVGEVIKSIVSTTTAVGTSGAYSNATSITLTPGVWNISGVISFYTNGTVTWTTGNDAELAITATSASVSGATLGYDRVAFAYPGNSSGQASTGAIPSKIVTVASNTTYYLNYYSQYTGTGGLYAGSISAARIA